MENKGEHCENCGEFVEGFEYEYCCSGYMCGCMGLPIEPCVCSGDCYEELFGKRKQLSDKDKKLLNID